MSNDVDLIDVVASFSLIALVLGLSLWRQLGLERSIVTAAARATVQLIAVGLLFTAIFESSLRALWAWSWVVAMVLLAGEIVRRRTGAVPGIRLAAISAIAATTLVVIAVVFGLQIFDLNAVNLVVVTGITIGNTLPALVLATDRMTDALRQQVRDIEARLALGFNAQQSTATIERDIVRAALIAQIERTKVVGLISLPGAMTGLLLAGVDPIDAVLVQLLVMFLVLGAVATAVVIVGSFVTKRSLTADLRVSEWVKG